MSMISCPKCSAPAARGGYPVWVWIVAICFFPIGMLALLAPRMPSTCPKCGHMWAG